MAIKEKSQNYLQARILTTNARIAEERQIASKGGDGRISNELRKTVIQSLESDVEMYEYLYYLTVDFKK